MESMDRTFFQAVSLPLTGVTASNTKESHLAWRQLSKVFFLGVQGWYSLEILNG